MIVLRHVALWLTGLAMLIASLLLYVEYRSKVLSINSVSIEVLPVESEFENVTISKDSITLNDELQRWYDANKSRAINDILLDERFLTISEIDKTAIAILLSRNYFEAKRYQDVVTILETLTKEQRLLNELQFKYALSLSRLDNTAKAVIAYENLVEYAPNAQSAHINLALLYRRNNQCDHAEVLYAHTANISSGRIKAKALSGLADCQMRREDYASAESNYALAIQYQPTQANLWMDLAEAQNALHQPYSVIKKTLHSASQLNQNSALIQSKKANIELANLDFLTALESADKSIKINPSSNAFRIKAWALIELGNRSAANKAVKSALNESPSTSRTAELKAMQLYIKRDYKNVIKQLQNRKLTPTKRYLKGLAFRRSGQFDNALRRFGAVEKNKDFYWRSALHKTRIQRSRKQYEATINEYTRLLSHQNNAAFINFELALVAERLQRFVFALDNIHQALIKQPDNRVYALTKARLQFVAGDTESALNDIDKLVSQHPRYIRAYQLQADILQNTDNTEALQNTYEIILALEPTSVDIRYKLAALMHNQEEYKAASTELVELLENDATHIDARLLLAKVFMAMGNNSQARIELNLLLKLNPVHLSAQELLNDLQQITQS